MLESCVYAGRESCPGYYRQTAIDIFVVVVNRPFLHFNKQKRGQAGLT